MRLANATLHDGSVVDIDVSDGVIVAISPAESSAAACERIDLDGRRVVPGLWDEHVHVRAWAIAGRRVSVREAKSAAGVASIIRSAMQDAPVGLPLVAVGMRDGMWSSPPERALLDEVSDEVPIMVNSSDLHSSWSNGALGRLLSIDLDDSGMLRETQSFDAMTRVDAMFADIADEWIAEALAGVGARGVVGVVDLDFADAAGAWMRRALSPIRIDAGIYPHDLELASERGLSTGAELRGLATVGPLKVITDGSLGTRTAYCHAPYPGTNSHGQLEVPPRQLTSLLRRGKDLGLSPAIHAIGDAANSLVLDAFEAVGISGRIEHAQLVNEQDVARMAGLGITASIQPEHMLDDRELIAKYWSVQAADAFRIRSLLDAGVDVVFGSDAPVTPLDPWLAISAAVTRTRGDDTPWQADESIDIETALRLSSRTHIEVGAPADLIALGAELTPALLATMPVDCTIVAGMVTHSTI